MQLKIKYISPEAAARYLERNHCQRPKSRPQIDEFKEDLRRGRARTTHQGIATDEEGRLRDGQNRLTAIVETGIGMKLVVAEGLTEEEIEVIDYGRRRTDSHALTMHVGETVSSFVTAIVREMYAGGTHLADGGRKRKPSRLDLLAFYDRYREQIHFAAEVFKNHDTGLSIAFLGAVIARAAVSHKGRRLDHFGKVLADGFATKDEDQIIIRLRNHILKERRTGKNNAAQRDALYAKTERVLKAYLDREELTTITAAKEELFPLDEDTHGVAAADGGG